MRVLTSYMQSHVHGSRIPGSDSVSWEVDTFYFQIQVLGIHFTASQYFLQHPKGQAKQSRREKKKASTQNVFINIKSLDKKKKARQLQEE